MTSTPAASPPALLHVTECLASGTLSFLTLATRELARAGTRQCLLFSRRPDTPAHVERLFDASVELQELPSLGQVRLPAYASALRQALRQRLSSGPCAAVHFHSSKAGFVGRLAMKGLGPSLPPQFYSPHGLAFLDDSAPWKPVAFRALESLTARLSDCTPVGCSQGEADLLDRLGGRRARTVENAIDDDFFHLRRMESQPPVVLSVGRACFQKAPERFADLAARFRIAELPAHFVWVGDGDPAIEVMLKAAGVHVTGWVDRKDVQTWLARASVYVQTSRWEGMPLAVLQALGSGVPCVVTDVVGNRDAVRQGITGFVCGRQEALVMSVKRLLDDDALRSRMSFSARSDAMERFGHRSFRARLCELYGIADASAGLGAQRGTLLPFGRQVAPPAGVPGPASGQRIRA